MELCEGGDLFARIKERKRFSEREAALVLKQIASALKSCHAAGVVHRDLKPENILMCSRDSDTDIKLADFGVAAFIKPG
jgi:serine/threonine protein kinase